MVESFSIDFLYLKMTMLSSGPDAELLQKIYCVLFGFCQMYGSFLNMGIIMCGVAVTLCIIMTAFSVSVRLCCAGVKSCLRGCQQAGKADNYGFFLTPLF